MCERTYYDFDRRLDDVEPSMLILCVGCACSFHPRRKNQFFCTRSCQNATYMRFCRQQDPTRHAPPSREEQMWAAHTEIIGL